MTKLFNYIILMRKEIFETDGWEYLTAYITFISQSAAMDAGGSKNVWGKGSNGGNIRQSYKQMSEMKIDKVIKSSDSDVL